MTITFPLFWSWRLAAMKYIHPIMAAFISQLVSAKLYLSPAILKIYVSSQLEGDALERPLLKCSQVSCLPKHSLQKVVPASTTMKRWQAFKLWNVFRLSFADPHVSNKHTHTPTRPCRLHLLTSTFTVRDSLCFEYCDCKPRNYSTAIFNLPRKTVGKQLSGWRNQVWG